MQLGRELKNIFLAKLHFLKNEAGGGGGEGLSSPIPFPLSLFCGPCRFTWALGGFLCYTLDEAPTFL